MKLYLTYNVLLFLLLLRSIRRKSGFPFLPTIAWVHNFGGFCFWQCHAIPRHTCLPNEYLWWDFKREIELFFMVNFSHFLIAIELLTSFTAHHVLHQFSLIRGFLISYQGFSHPSHPLLCPCTPFPFCTTEPSKSHTNTHTIRIEDERLFSLSFEI